MEMQYKFMMIKRLIYSSDLNPLDLLMCILYVIDPDKVRLNLAKIRDQLNRM